MSARVRDLCDDCVCVAHCDGDAAAARVARASVRGTGAYASQHTGTPDATTHNAHSHILALTSHHVTSHRSRKPMSTKPVVCYLPPCRRRPSIPAQACCTHTHTRAHAHTCSRVLTALETGRVDMDLITTGRSAAQRTHLDELVGELRRVLVRRRARACASCSDLLHADDETTDQVSAAARSDATAVGDRGVGCRSARRASSTRTGTCLLLLYSNVKSCALCAERVFDAGRWARCDDTRTGAVGSAHGLSDRNHVQRHIAHCSIEFITFAIHDALAKPLIVINPLLLSRRV
jgi:hypothetical protein